MLLQLNHDEDLLLNKLQLLCNGNPIAHLWGVVLWQSQQLNQEIRVTYNS